ILLFACTPARSNQDGSPAASSAPAQPKRITIMLKVEPTVMAPELGSSGGGVVMGTAELASLVHRGLSIENADGNRIAQLATTLPSVENGLWKVQPDGRMELTWKINPAAKWQDGTPFTSADLLFTLEAKRD